LRELLDKLGVKPRARVALVDLDEPWFGELLRTRTGEILKGARARDCDIVFFGAHDPTALRRISTLKGMIKPNGAIWVIRLKGGRGPIGDTDVIDAGLQAGLVDNKIASFSDTQAAMRLVFRLRDRPR
jgi:hypothetical protein